MQAIVSGTYGFIQGKVEEPDTSQITPHISFHKGLVTVVIVVLVEIGALLAIFFLVVPPNTLLPSIRNVNASRALQQPAECYQWIDSTAYGANGVLVTNWGPGPIYTSKPLLGKDIRALVPNLTCTPPGPTTGSAMVGYVQLLGYTSITGQYQHTCTDPNQTIIVNPVSVSLDQACILARDHIKEIHETLLSADPSSINSARLWGMQCATFPLYSTASLSFRWSLADHLPFTVDVSVQCPSGNMDSLMATLATYGIKSLPPDAVALLNSSKPEWNVCLRPTANFTRCAVALLKSVACKRVPFLAVAAVGLIDCTNARKYSSNACSPKVQQQYDCGGAVNSTCQPYAYGDLPELDQNMSMINRLAMAVLSPNFCDTIQLVGQCPGSVYPFRELLAFFRNALVFLDDNLKDYDQRDAFTFTCIVSTPPGLQSRLSYILPYCNIVHTVALTYLVRYVYKLLRMSESLVGTRSADGASADAADEENKEPPLPDAVQEHLKVLEDVYPTISASPRHKAAVRISSIDTVTRGR